MTHVLATPFGLVCVLLQAYGPDPAFAPVQTLAERSERLAQQALTLGPETPAGRAYAREAARHCVYAFAALGLTDAPSESDVSAARSALAACMPCLPSHALVEALTPVRQSEGALCAIASARMLLSHWKLEVPEGELLRMVGTQAIEDGVHVSFIGRCLPLYGVSVLACEGDTALLRAALAAGLPVAVYQWITAEEPVPHMRVVVGYDASERLTWRLVDPAPQMPLVWDASDELFQALWECPWDDEDHTSWMCVPYALIERD